MDRDETQTWWVVGDWYLDEASPVKPEAPQYNPQVSP